MRTLMVVFLTNYEKKMAYSGSIELFSQDSELLMQLVSPLAHIYSKRIIDPSVQSNR